MPQKEQHVVIYSDEASMASGNGNGDNLNLVASPSAVEEVSNVLVPQIPTQPAPPLFDDRRIFINAPQYHLACYWGRHGSEVAYHRTHPAAWWVRSEDKGQRSRDVEEIGVGCHNRYDASHPSSTLYRDKVMIRSNAESAGSTARKRFRQDGCKSCLTEGWLGPPEGGIGPRTRAKWGKTEDPDWVVGARFDQSMCLANAQTAASCNWGG